MRTLSDHIFDLAQNSVNAEASNIKVSIEENIPGNTFVIRIEDDGRGIKPEHLSKVKDTFFTTRPSDKRNVGLGISLMDATCQRCGGSLDIQSNYRHGTKLITTMEHDNLDRPPLGDLPAIFTSLILSSLENKVKWVLEHAVNDKRYQIRNRATMEELNILSYSDPEAKRKLLSLIKAKERSIRS
ncbi:MAG: ATP-binding protein [Thermoplasmata archaeon]|nr:ATP-binding protein [Thermoplasmata archaeon]